jgi:hypothetical protein
MKPRFGCAAVAAAVAIIFPLSAAADVDVTVNPKAPGVVFGAKESRPSSKPIASESETPNSNPKAPQNALTCSPVSCGSSFQTLPGQPEVEDPELTEGDIVRAVREIGLPSLPVKIQPGEETLVNIETIFYTRPQPFERSITLLGFDIDLVAEPVRYTWVHDDGTVSTTTRPGKPYPAMDVTHRYREPADNVRPRVDVTYRVRYRVDGAEWQTIGQTLQASGPAAELDVREAAPVLTRR